MQLQEKIDVRARKKTLKMLFNKNRIQQKFGFGNATKKLFHCNFVEHLQYGNYDVENLKRNETRDNNPVAKAMQLYNRSSNRIGQKD